MKSRSIRTLDVLASAGLIVSAFAAAPADAAKKKTVPACAEFAPPPHAAEAEVVKLTDADTADAPVEITVPTAVGFGMGRDPSHPEGQNVSHAYVPVQVDSAVTGARIYGKVNFTALYDYDPVPR